MQRPQYSKQPKEVQSKKLLSHHVHNALISIALRGSFSPSGHENSRDNFSPKCSNGHETTALLWSKTTANQKTQHGILIDAVVAPLLGLKACACHTVPLALRVASAQPRRQVLGTQAQISRTCHQFHDYFTVGTTNYLQMCHSFFARSEFTCQRQNVNCKR